MIKSFLFQQGSKMFTLEQDSSLKTHTFEVIYLIFLKQQLFLNVLDHIDVVYEYYVPTTKERGQIRKSEPYIKLNSSFQVYIQFQTWDWDKLMYCNKLFFSQMERYITQTGHPCSVSIGFGT